MSTFYDTQGRPHTLNSVDRNYTHLTSLVDNAKVMIANTYFNIIFSDARPAILPSRLRWPL